MKSAADWYKKFHPNKLGIEEKEQFLEMVKEIQLDALLHPAQLKRRKNCSICKGAGRIYYADSWDKDNGEYCSCVHV